jgi:choline-sulfatase
MEEFHVEPGNHGNASQAQRGNSKIASANQLLADAVALSGAIFAMRVIAVWAILVASLSAQSGEKHNSQPDVFLITIDTLRADHVRCFGYEHIQTPALDGLAKDGVRFTQAFTPSPITNTSHVTILTGLMPSTHGVTDFALPLAATHPTLAELLKKRGYHTAAFIGSIILDSKSFAPGLDRGFDFYDNFPESTKNKSRWGRLERRGMVVAEHAEAWLATRPAGPHFVWVHFYDPHDPYEPPLPYSQIYKDRLYDGEIAYADSALASFVRFLNKRGLYENSIVIVVGDHGEGLGEHHEETHGVFLYDSTTHVPLIIKLPGRRDAGKLIEEQVRTLDILPTVLGLLQMPEPERLDGESLQPYLVSDNIGDRTAVAETDYPLHFGWAPLRSMRTGGFKFIEAPKPELYDLRRDPGELQNTYAPWDSTVQKFRTALSEWRSKTPPSEPSAGSVGKNTREELKALGYLGRADVGTSTNVPEPSLLPDPKDRIEEQNLLHRAMMAAEDGRDSEARTALEKVVELDPNSAIALGQLGQLELHAENYEKAAEHLKRSFGVRPNDAAIAFDEGQALEKTGDLPGAREALTASLKLAPSQFLARLLLGQVYLRLKDPKAAEDQFEAALLLHPRDRQAELGLKEARNQSRSESPENSRRP